MMLPPNGSSGTPQPGSPRHADFHPRNAVSSTSARAHSVDRSLTTNNGMPLVTAVPV